MGNVGGWRAEAGVTSSISVEQLNNQIREEEQKRVPASPTSLEKPND